MSNPDTWTREAEDEHVLVPDADRDVEFEAE